MKKRKRHRLYRLAEQVGSMRGDAMDAEYNVLLFYSIEKLPVSERFRERISKLFRQIHEFADHMMNGNNLAAHFILREIGG